MKRTKEILLSTILLFSSAMAFAQSDSLTVKRTLFNHADLGVTLGTTGLGVDFAMPIGDMVKVRTGFSYMPKFNVPLKFNLMSYSNGVVTDGNFAKAQELLKGMTGFDVSQEVKVDAKPNIFT